MEGVGDGLEVNLGLAAAGDAMQKKRRKLLPVGSREQGVKGRLLVAIQFPRDIALAGLLPEGVAIHLPLLLLHQSQFRKTFELCPALAEAFAQFSCRDNLFIPDELQNLRSLGAQGAWRVRQCAWPVVRFVPY